MFILQLFLNFSIRDLLFGEPCHFTMKSMSYVFLYSIKYHQIKHVFPMPMPGEENDFWDPINEEKARIQANIDQMVNIYAQFAKRKSRKQEDRAVAIPSWVRVPKKPAEEYPDPKEPGYREKRKAILINKEYENLFKLIKFGKLWKYAKTLCTSICNGLVKFSVFQMIWLIVFLQIVIDETCSSSCWVVCKSLDLPAQSNLILDVDSNVH